MPPLRNDVPAITEILRTSPIVLQSAHALMRDTAISVKTLRGSAKAAFVAALCSLGDLPFIIIVSSDDEVDAHVHDVGLLLAAHRVVGIHGATKHSSLASGGIVHHEQVDALTRLRSDSTEPYVVIISVAALGLAMPSTSMLEGAQWTLERSSERNYDTLLRTCLLAFPVCRTKLAELRNRTLF